MLQRNKNRLKEGAISTENRFFLSTNIKSYVLFSLPAVSALCMTFSLPGFDYSILAWFGLAPYLYALRQMGVFAAAGLGFIFGYFYGLGTFYWLPITQDVSLIQFLLIIVPTFSLFYLPFGLLYRQISPAVGSWMIVVAPALWVTIEYTRANFFFLALPWNFIGHSQYQYLSLIQIAGLTGMYGISFLIVMVNQFLSQLPELNIRQKKDSSSVTASKFFNYKWVVPLFMIIITFAFTFFYGFQKIKLPESDASLRLALIQANVVTRNNMTKLEQKEHLQAYRQLSLKAAEKAPEIIIWPASSLPARITSTLVRQTVQQIARETGVYLLVGGAGIEKFSTRKKSQVSFSNSEFLYTPAGRVKGKYNKMRLVPFDEYLPLQDKIPWPEWVTSLKFSFIRGEEYTLFEVNGAKFGTPICWENMYSNLVRRFVKAGAQFMINVTNEGYTGRTSAPYQTLAMTVFRAVENRVPVLRAATTGVSCYISPNGEIVERISDSNGDDLFVSGILVKDVPLYASKTFYTKHGDIFAFAALGVVALCLLFSLYKRWPSRAGMRN